MADKINANKLGLTLGILFGLIHLLWSLVVLSGYGKSMMDWIFGLHFIGIDLTINSFNLMSAIILIIVTFIAGYVAGWVFAALWNWVGKKSK